MFDFAPPPPDSLVPLQQSAAFNRALMRLGVDVSQHALPGGTASVLVRRVPGLGRMGVVSRGPVWNGHAPHHRAKGLAAMRAALGLKQLLISPECAEDADDLGLAGFIRVARPAQHAMLSLSGGLEDWLRRMDQKWRNRLRHGMRQGLVLERHEFCPRKAHWLFEADRAQQKRRRYRNIPHRVVAEIARTAPGSAQLFVARNGRDPLAAMLFLRHGGIATYQIGWTGDAGKRASAHNLLMWEAMQWLAPHGAQRIDLGTLNPGRTPGLDRFKLGSGAVAQPLGGTWLDSAWGAPVHRILRHRAAARHSGGAAGFF